MALSEQFVDDHISRWSRQLDIPSYPHRKHWPSHLFHHAPLENAIAILRDGCLRARADEQNCHPKDIAAPGVIDTNDYAHSRVRLYFRPKTPTQYSIEGIRKNGECKFGENTHLPFIVMFCLDARQVLLGPDLRFSDRNMQVSDPIVGQSEEEFAAIPFGKVYHEGPIADDRSIIEARCAEVMPNSPLALNGSLRAILFRSGPERETFLYLLGDDRPTWEPFCHISDALKVFQKNYTFVTHLQLTLEGLVFRLNQRRDGRPIHTHIRLTTADGILVADKTYENLPARPDNGGNWIEKVRLDQGEYIATIRLEGHLAYECKLSLEDELV